MWFVLPLVLGIGVLPTATWANASLADLVDQVRPAVVGVGTAYPQRQETGGKPPYQLAGTGFAVADGQLIVTNYHVIPEELDWARRQSLAIFIGRGAAAQALPAKLVASDKTHDLAVLRFSGRPLPVLRLSGSDNVREGDPVAFTGYPIGAVLGLYPATHRGVISTIAPISQPVGESSGLTPLQLKRMRNPFDVFQLDATAYPGNSGSPVYSRENGAVIGVLNSVFVKQTRESLLQQPSGISYAIPIQHACALLAQFDGNVCGNRSATSPEEVSPESSL